MCILNLQEIEVLLPVRAFFLEGCRTVANLDPLHGSILELPGFIHISEIFVSGDGSPAQGSPVDCAVQTLFLARFYFCGNEVSHATNCTTIRVLSCPCDLPDSHP